MNSALLAQKWLSQHDPGFAKKSKRLFLFCVGANPKIKTISKVCVKRSVCSAVSCHRDGQAHGFVGKGRQSWLSAQRAAVTLHFQNSTLLKQNLSFFASFAFSFWTSCVWFCLVSKNFQSVCGTWMACSLKQMKAFPGGIVRGRFEPKQPDSPSALARLQQAEPRGEAEGGCWAWLSRHDTRKEASAARCGCPVLGKVVKWQD